MSHAIVSKSESTKITNIADLQAGAVFLGLLFTKKGHYRTWKDDHGGKWVGDWPLPEGVSAAAMGDNADYVISVPKDQQLPGQTCYELGIVRDEEAKCWYPAHDFWGGGNGLEAFVGATTVEGKKVVKSHQKLMDAYKAAGLARHYRAQGKNVSVQKQNEKLVLRIQ